MARHGIPTPLTSFVGRTHEIGAVRRLLETARLVTLVGPGGVGKTRLALTVARRVRARYPDGVHLVPFAAIRDPRLVIQTIAQTLGVRETSGRPLIDTLMDDIGERAVLLVVDNFEQIVAAGPDLATLLAAAPRLRILVTSRSPVHVGGEHTFEVPPLDLPPRDALAIADVERVRRWSATRLFVERAHAASSAFTLTTDDAPVVAEICRRLDGLPLAIELAASRTRHLPPGSLLDRLEQRLTLLTGGPRDAPARQQTLRDAIAWSYDLLTPVEQRLFRQLGVFVGGFDLEAASWVTGDGGGGASGTTPSTENPALSILDLVASLVDQSLVRQDPTPQRPGVPARFLMLETIRELAVERLQASEEEPALRRRHARYFLRLAEECEPLMRTALQRALVNRLDTDLDNLRSAMLWALSEPGAGEIGLGIASALGQFWLIHSSLSEGRRWLNDAMQAAPDAPVPLRGRALYGAGRLAHFQGDYAEAERLLGQSLAILRAGDDDQQCPRVLSTLGLVAVSRGDYPRAVALFEEAVELDERFGNALGAATTRTNLARALLEQGDLTGASALLDDAIPVFRQHGDDWGLAVGLSRLGIVARMQGDPDRAVALSRESVQLCHGIDDRRVMANAVQTIGLVALARGEHPRAVRLLTIAGSLRDALGVPLYPAERPAFEQILATALSSLSRAEIEAATAEVRSMSRDEIYRYVLVAAEPQAERSATSLSSPGASDRGPLSAREADVAALVAAGLANQQIAERLVISERTVETHVRNLRTRLGLPNRAAVAAWAAERRLTPSD